nr:RNA-directed DNA polymerase, eukaryota, reverse transcriptase zinc-binding domain protein [Tanacetum cinerariifolium]
MPEDEDGFLWKLNKYVGNIRKERNGFVRTFAAADVVLRDNTLIDDVYQQYRKTLSYKDGISKGKSSSQLSGDNNEEPHEVCTVQIAGDIASKDYDSPVFALGQATQKEVFTMVDKVVDEFHSSKKQINFEAPSFSLGVTQDFEMVLSLESPVTDRHTHAPGSTHNLEPIEAVPLSMCKPVLKGGDLGNARGKRKYTKSQGHRLDQDEVLFETETGTMASTLQMESLVNGEIIDDGVVDAWCEFLNLFECLRSETSMSRFFLPTFIVDKKLFGIEAKANESVTKFLLNVEKVNERGGMKSIINLVDLKEDLERIISKEEVKRAMRDCGIDKSSGPDGFSFSFYRHFWPIIEKDVFKAVEYFFKYGDIPNRCNSNFIALIPKILVANMVKDFRPISLIESLYKIIAKILANRLVGVLGDIVNEVQYAFVADRQILDGPFILEEVLHWCRRKKKHTLIFKVDFEKAFNSMR